jgi:hypothetical protein
MFGIQCYHEEKDMRENHVNVSFMTFTNLYTKRETVQIVRQSLRCLALAASQNARPNVC